MNFVDLLVIIIPLGMVLLLDRSRHKNEIKQMHRTYDLIGMLGAQIDILKKEIDQLKRTPRVEAIKKLTQLPRPPD